MHVVETVRAVETGCRRWVLAVHVVQKGCRVLVLAVRIVETDKGCRLLVLAVRMVETGGAGCARGGDSVWKAGVLHGS